MAYRCKVHVPRVLICAPNSGSGKTLVSCALMRILKKKGYKVAGFKCGPDYIDPMFHKKVLGVPSRNLDLFMAGDQGVKRTLRSGSTDSDVAVIEGVMGFFDGQGAVSVEGSSYDLCRKIKTPAILVVNAKGMSRSVIPLIKGFCTYNPDGGENPIKGIILNNISPMIAREISGEIEKELGLPVLGFLPKLEGDLFTSRHLGLVLPDEIPDILEKVDKVADKLLENLDLERLMEIAGGAQDLEVDIDDDKKELYPTKVGVAYDEAFCFYYEDNLDLLKSLGAEIKFFSPIHDKEIPEVDRLILGGGYPELYGRQLMENSSMRKSIKEAAEGGMPILAECGGFLYLQREMTDIDGNTAQMAGVLEGESRMTSKLSHFGYVNVSALRENPFIKEGEMAKGHEFHYYDTSCNGNLLKMEKPSGKRSWEGYQLYKNVFGGFTHLYYPSCPEFIRRFLAL